MTNKISKKIKSFLNLIICSYVIKNHFETVNSEKTNIKGGMI